MSSEEVTSAASGTRLPFILLILLVPLLVGYDVYFQCSTATLDFGVDFTTGEVLYVAQESFANWAGLWEGDVILSVEGVPFSEWHSRVPGNYLIDVQRGARRLTLELPFVPLVKVNRWPLMSGTLTALLFWGVGTALLWRRPGYLDVRLLFILLQVAGVAALFLLAHPPQTRVPWMTRLSMSSFHLAGALIFHHLLTFPRRLGAGRYRRLLLGGVYAFTTLMVMAIWSSRSEWSPWGVAGTTAIGLGALGVWGYRYLRLASPEERLRLRLILFGLLGTALPLVALYILPSLWNGTLLLPLETAGLFLVLAPLGYFVATIRYRLFDIDRMLNRALVYGLLSLGILFLYLGPFMLLYRFLPGDVAAQILIVSILTLAIGLGFDWARTHAQRGMDRFFYGGWYDYPRVVETISDALARTLEREMLIEVLTEQVPELMRLRYARWYAPTETPETPVPGHLLTFSLVFQDEVRARWHVGPRQDGDDFSATDRRILHTVAREAEIALGNVLLVEALHHRLEELRQLQRQLLRSREEERSRVARDLHDGPLQLLVGLNLQLSLLSAQVAAAEGENTAEMLRDELRGLRAEVRQLLDDLRRVCADLRPPLLDTLGLGAALRALAESWSVQHALPLDLRLAPDTDLQPLSLDVAVNLYRVVQEALANVARHAMAQHVALELRLTAGQLRLAVCDDGRGFVVPEKLQSLTAGGHFGLIGMQERVALIGGRLEVNSTPGQGTQVGVLLTL